MVGRGDDNNVAGQAINLKKQRADDAFDLAGLMGISALFGYDIELVEKQYARTHSDSVEQRLQSRGCLAEEAPDQPFIADTQQGNGEFRCDGLSERCVFRLPEALRTTFDGGVQPHDCEAGLACDVLRRID